MARLMGSGDYVPYAYTDVYMYLYLYITHFGVIKSNAMRNAINGAAENAAKSVDSSRGWGGALWGSDVPLNGEIVKL